MNWLKRNLIFLGLFIGGMAGIGLGTYFTTSAGPSNTEYYSVIATVLPQIKQGEIVYLGTVLRKDEYITISSKTPLYENYKIPVTGIWENESSEYQTRVILGGICIILGGIAAFASPRFMKESTKTEQANQTIPGPN